MQDKLESFDLSTYPNCSNLCTGRQYALDDALKRGFTHALLLDDDMTFMPELADQMVRTAVEQRADLVGVNYSQKAKDGTPTALGVNGKYVMATSGVLPVKRMGFGALLVNLGFVKKVPLPWFEMRWIPEHEILGPHHLGEDFYFCDKMAGHGAKIVCDLNIKVGHIGDYEYMLNDPLFAPVRVNANRRKESERAEKAA